MDPIVESLFSIIREQLQVESVQSLQVQNHIYGCFVIMEEIVDKTMTLDHNIITATDYTFDLDVQFAEIGIRYGFILDTKLIFDCSLPGYKDAWLELFRNSIRLDAVDQIEDTVIEMIRSMVDPDLAFFLHAMDTGQLPQQWIQKAIGLLLPPIHKIVIANPEKPIKKASRFHTTRRHHIFLKKPLGKTRRAMKQM
jgi:hypothetical protein